MSSERSLRSPARSLLPRAGRGRAGAPRVAVWGHYHGANLGDELVVSTVVSAVRTRVPDAEVCAICLDPSDARARHGVPAFPLTPKHSPGARPRGWRRLLAGLRRRVVAPAREIKHGWRAYRMLRHIDLVVVAGSGQLLDRWNGPWGHPWALFKWSMLMRLAGARLAILSVGAGPLDGRLARWFVRQTVDSAAYVTVRDEGTLELLQAVGVTRELRVCPDMAFGRDAVPPRSRPAGVGDGGRLTLGVNVMAHADPDYWGRGDVGRYETYIARMTRVVRGALEDGVIVRLFSSHATADQRAADDVIAAVWSADPRLAPRLIRESVHEVDELVDLVAQCDAVVGVRYHSVVVPLRLGIPTVAIAYDPKTVHVMSMAGQSRFCFPDIDHLDHVELSQRIRELIEQRATIREDLRARIQPLRTAVIRQFDEVLQPAVGDRSQGIPAVSGSERGRHIA